MLSIITPTFNRAHKLGVVFDSLLDQSNYDFEWIIVDDGSSDDTKTICRSFTSDKFPIYYTYKKNGGKHTAVNEGVRMAKGDFVLILDSDDSLPSTSVKTIMDYCRQIDDDPSFGGVAGYMAHHDGKVIGHGFKHEIIDATVIDMRYKYNLCGDMCEVFRTSVLKEFPFPEIDGERFCPEALVWNRIAKKYKLRYFPEVVYYRDYLDGGLTDNIIRIRMKSPVLACTCYAEMNCLPIPFIQRAKAAINYWRFRLCVHSQVELPAIDMWWVLIWPISLLMHIRDKKHIGL